MIMNSRSTSFLEMGSKALLEKLRKPEERTVTVWYLTVGVGLTDTGIKVFEDLDSNEQQAATTVREIMRMLAYQEILKEKKWPLSR
jgi:hypothetical protein